MDANDALSSAFLQEFLFYVFSFIKQYFSLPYFITGLSILA